MRILKRGMAAIAISLASMGAACTTSTPGNVSGLSGVMGDYLPGTKGLTKEDQRNIDLTVAGGCSGGVYKPGACKRHTVASRERNAAFKEQ